MHRMQWQDIALPLILFFTGTVLIGADWVGLLSLDRIANLWPIALVLIGLCASVSGNDHGKRETDEQYANRYRTN